MASNRLGRHCHRLPASRSQFILAGERGDPQEFWEHCYSLGISKRKKVSSIKEWRDDMGKKGLFFLTLLFLFGLPGSLAQVFAQDVATESLFGLKAVRVEVKPMEGSDERVQEIDLAQVLAQTEEQMTEAGLTILPEDEYLRLRRSFGYPLGLVEVLVGVFPIQDSDLLMYAGHVRLNQVVYMARRPVLKFLAPTWEVRGFGATKDLPSLRERIKGTVARLVQDYQSAGPPQ